MEMTGSAGFPSATACVSSFSGAEYTLDSILKAISLLALS